MMGKRNGVFVKSWGSIVLVFFLLFSVMAPLQIYATTEQDDKLIIVSMGDSFSSGEGIEPFYEQKNEKGKNRKIEEKVKEADWLAHRSTLSWPGQMEIDGIDGKLAEHRDENWFFVAASGAVTADIENVQTKDYRRKDVVGSKDLEPQKNVFAQFEKGEVDYVTITIGGNNVGFSEIITAAATSGYRDVNLLSTLLTNAIDGLDGAGGTLEKIENTYKTISENAGTQAHIVVAGYPKLINEKGAWIFFSEQEATMINNAVVTFNGKIQGLVNQCAKQGMNISFVDVMTAFEGHEAYTGNSYINGIILGTKSEELVDKKINEGSNYSIHPNKYGAQAYALCVEEEINKLEKEKNGPRKATEEELNAKAMKSSWLSSDPEDVLLKFFEAMKESDYESAVECLDPRLEEQFKRWGGLASSLYEMTTGENLSWGEMMAESSGAVDIEVIDCYSTNMVMESDIGLFAELVPKIKFARNLFCTEADVVVKYRYKNGEQYYVTEETIHVKHHGLKGWRIDMYYDSYF